MTSSARTAACRHAALAVVLGLTTLLCVAARAGETLLLNYYLDVQLESGNYVLQEQGIRFGAGRPLVLSFGDTECRVTLLSLQDGQGTLVLEIHDQAESASVDAALLHAMEVDFTVGGVGEVSSSGANIAVEFAYSIARW